MANQALSIVFSGISVVQQHIALLDRNIQHKIRLNKERRVLSVLENILLPPVNQILQFGSFLLTSKVGLVTERFLIVYNATHKIINTMITSVILAPVI